MVKFGKILDIIKKMPDFTLMNSVTCSEEDILLAVVVDGKTWTWLCLSWDKIVEKTENDRGKKDNGEVEKRNPKCRVFCSGKYRLIPFLL